MKLDPNIYREAAKLVDSGENRFSCFAISSAACANSALCSVAFINAHINAYEDMFGPLDWSNYQDHPFWNKKPTQRRQQMRVLALLLMADIVEQGL